MKKNLFSLTMVIGLLLGNITAVEESSPEPETPTTDTSKMGEFQTVPLTPMPQNPVEEKKQPGEKKLQESLASSSLYIPEIQAPRVVEMDENGKSASDRATIVHEVPDEGNTGSKRKSGWCCFGSKE